MKLYTMEECEQWCGYYNYYSFPEKQYMFQPKNEKGEAVLHRHIVNTDRKSFSHDIKLVENIIEKVVDNYPKLEKCLEKLLVYMCPKYDLENVNACADETEMTFFAKSTQIPTFMTDYIVPHELGHVLMFNYYSKHKNKEIMRKYLKLRNAPYGQCKSYDHYDDDKNEWVYNYFEEYLYLYGSHKDQNPVWDETPYEWFAEDFRYFFGVDKQEYWGLPIEKPNEKIRDFILSL